MTDTENKIFKYFDDILSRQITELDRKYYEWLKTQIREINLTSVYDIFSKNELSQIIDTLNPQLKGCYDFSYKATFYDSKINSVIGYQVLFGNIFFGHAINKIMIDNQTFYVDFINEIVNQENILNLKIIALHEFTNDEMKYYMNKTPFPDRLPYVWFQENIFPKKIIRP